MMSNSVPRRAINTGELSMPLLVEVVSMDSYRRLHHRNWEEDGRRQLGVIMHSEHLLQLFEV